MSTLRIEDLSIVGTTTPVRSDDLPARLVPLLRHQDGHHYLLVEGDAPGEVALDLVGDAWISQQEADGDILLFAVPIAARSGHVLLQTAIDEGPEYFPEAELRHRLAELGDRALRAAAIALSQGDKQAAERHAWYASRATPERPLPLMLLRALLRREIPEDQLAYLENAIRELPARERAEVLDTGGASLKAVCDFIRADAPEDPVWSRPSPQMRRPSYLDGFENDPTFLRRQRRSLAAMGHSLAAIG